MEVLNKLAEVGLELVFGAPPLKGAYKKEVKNPVAESSEFGNLKEDIVRMRVLLNRPHFA